MHASPVLYARGPYRVVTNSAEPPHDLYVVLDTAGAWHREEMTFEAARDWVDRREGDVLQRGLAPLRRGRAP